MVRLLLVALAALLAAPTPASAGEGGAAGAVPAAHPAVGKVITVFGEIEPTALGAVLAHEHVLINLAPARGIFLGDIASAVEEIAAFVRAPAAGLGAGRTVVDLTAVGIRLPDHAANLQYVSEMTGAHIVMGCGYYKAAWNQEARLRAVDDLAREMRDEIAIGFPGGARAGVIGELGISGRGAGARLAAGFEENVLRAAARVQAMTGVGIALHFDIDGSDLPPSNWPLRLQVLRFLGELGVPADALCIAHCAPFPRDPPRERLLALCAAQAGDPAWDLGEEQLLEKARALCRANDDGMRAALAAGAYLSFDGWGTGRTMADFPADLHVVASDRYAQYAAAIQGLIGLDGRFAERLLLSQDVCTPAQLAGHGGCGYAHLSAVVIPYLRAAGLGEREIALLAGGNAQRFLTVRAPAR
jgi:phosphotriesterase-related protein